MFILGNSYYYGMKKIVAELVDKNLTKQEQKDAYYFVKGFMGAELRYSIGERALPAYYRYLEENKNE